MNKNTLIAFTLILTTIWFFQSPFYYEKILKKEYPSKIIKRKEIPQKKEIKKTEKEKNSEKINIVDNYKKNNNTENNIEKNVKNDTIWVETQNMICGISEKGATLISVKMKKYKYSNGKDSGYIELMGTKKVGGAGLSIDNENFNNKHFTYNGNKKNIYLKNTEKQTVSFEALSQNGDKIKKDFVFFGDKYKVELYVKSNNLKDKNINISWNSGINESEISTGRSQQYNIRKVHLYDGHNVEHISMKKTAKKERTGYYKWVGITSKYFLISMIVDSVKDEDIFIKAFPLTEKIEKKQKKGPGNVNYGIDLRRTAIGNTEKFWFYMGPSELTTLKKQNINLQKVLFNGWSWFFWADKWFPALCEFVLWLLIELQKIFKDYGLVIIILTLISRLITYPLTQSSMKSMSRMKDIQPKINEIREKYKNNPKKMNDKIMELYKKEGLNPLNPGCLPMFLQMPILFSLFIVLRKSIELRGQGTFLVPWIHDLSQPEVLPFISPLPFNIPFYGNNVALLPILMAILTYFQNKATIKDPNQKAMIYFMPIFMLVLFNNFSSGLVLYWTFSSAIQVTQQYLMEKNKIA